MVLCLGVALIYGNQSNAQCSIVSLADTYCLDNDPIFLNGSPSGGTFTGPGVAGGIFDPAAAGVGVHTISYEFISGTDRYYVHSTVGDPWSNTSNNTSMNSAFGVDWTLAYFESLDPVAVFSVNTSFVFLEGSDDNANELSSFLSANLPEIEAWVAGGGVLLINAAPNEGSGMSFGFDATTLNYDGGSGSVTVTDLAHPVYLGPATPTASVMTGSNYTHATITGSGFTNILVHTSDASRVSLCEKDWGSGHVVMGGMTTWNFHSPSPQAENWRSNLFVYLDEYVVSGVVCTVTQDVEVIDEVSPEVTATSDVSEICLGESYTLTGSGAGEFYWGGDIVDGEAITQDVAGTFTHLLTGVSVSGCVGTSAVTVTVHPTPIVDGGLDMAQCVGMELTLNGSGADTYTWDPAVTDGEPFVVTEGEVTYTVTGTDVNGCENTDEVVVEGIGYPSITAVITGEYVPYGGEINLTVTGGSGPYGYSWSHGPITEDVTGLSAGTYTVTVDDVGVEDGVCPVVDSTFTLMSFIGVEELTENNFKVYPSPAVDNVTITFEGDFNYELTAINGDVIMSGTAVDQEIISVKELSAGTYVVNVIANDKVNTVKIIKQ